MEISEINTGTLEGRLLIAALSVITTESRRNETPDQVLKYVLDLSEKIYNDKNKLYYPGAKAIIIGNTTSHNFDNGDEVEILKRDNAGKAWLCLCKKSGDKWFAYKEDLKLI